METPVKQRITKAQKAEARALINTGATPDEVASLLSITPSQVAAVATEMRRTLKSEAVAISEQIRVTKSGVSASAAADAARRGLPDAIATLTKLIKEETDTSKVATAVKVLHAIATAGEEKSEVTRVVSRLRGGG